MKKQMSLKEAVGYITSNLTHSQAAKVLGVSPNQIYKYVTGYTKTCSDKVVDAIYDKFDILVDMYNSEEEYLKFRKLREIT